MPETLQEMFSDFGLPMPWTPPELAAKLSPAGEWSFATTEAPAPLYDIAAFEELAQDEEADDFLFVGHSGHGTSNWYLHYYLRIGPLTILLQTPWGGAYDEPDERREVVTAELKHIEQLGSAALEAGLTVVQSPVVESRWARIPAGFEEVQWHADDDALKAAADACASGPNSIIAV